MSVTDYIVDVCGALGVGYTITSLVSEHTVLNQYNGKTALFVGVVTTLAYGYVASKKDNLDKDLAGDWSSE